MNLVPRIEKACNDTSHSVAFSPDDTRIVAGGHFKCFETKPGSKVMRTRFGIAMFRASDLHLLSWRSDKCRAVGGRAMLWRPGGLWHGFDCDFWGNSEHVNPHPSPQFTLKRLAFLPAVAP